MGRPLYTNNAATYLAFGITNTATTMQVSANAGNLFPNPTGGDYFYVSLISLSGPIIEIVKCTARSGDIFTIERGQEGTSPLYWNMGDNVQLRITAAGMNYIAGAAVQSTEEQVFTATQGQTVFTLTNFDYAPGTNNLAVFVNGSKQVYGVNYSETSVNTVTFNSGLNAGDVVEFLVGISVASGTLYANEINYNEGGVNAVTNTVQSKLQESISVKDFGAKGDGTTDDSTAIQNALNAISTGGALFFPTGTYKYGTQLTATISASATGVYIYGEDATLNYTGTTTSGYDAFTIQTANNANANNLTVNGLKFMNGWSAFKVQGQGTGIYSNIKITNCTFDTSTSGMVWIYHCKDIIFSNNSLYRGGDNGLYLNFSTDAVISNNLCVNNQGSAGITVGYVDTVVTAAQNINVIGNTIYNDSSAVSAVYISGITVAYANNVLVSGNVIGNPLGVATGYGVKNGIIVEIDNIYDVSVKGNQIYNIPEAGIRVGYDTSSTINNINISDNQISNTQNAIYVYRTVNSQIANNVINFTYQSGIVLDSTCLGMNVVGNTIVDVNQQDPYGSYFGIYVNSPTSSITGNTFIDSQCTAYLTTTDSTPTYSVDATGNLILYSGSTVKATVPSTGVTWLALATAVHNAASSWTLHISPNIQSTVIISALRRTGTRAGVDVNKYPLTNLLMTAEAANYVYCDTSATGAIVTGNSYKTNTLGLPTIFGGAGQMFTYQSDTQYDLGVFGGSRKFVGTAIPSTGYYLEGDIVYNQNVFATGYVGWVCVTAGSPGTWKTFGAVSA